MANQYDISKLIERIEKNAECIKLGDKEIKINLAVSMNAWTIYENTYKEQGDYKLAFVNMLLEMITDKNETYDIEQIKNLMLEEEFNHTLFNVMNKIIANEGYLKDYFQKNKVNVSYEEFYKAYEYLNKCISESISDSIKPLIESMTMFQKMAENNKLTKIFVNDNLTKNMPQGKLSKIVANDNIEKMLKNDGLMKAMGAASTLIPQMNKFKLSEINFNSKIFSNINDIQAPKLAFESTETAKKSEDIQMRDYIKKYDIDSVVLRNSTPKEISESIKNANEYYTKSLEQSSQILTIMKEEKETRLQVEKEEKEYRIGAEKKELKRFIIATLVGIAGVVISIILRFV